jgi:hypothetical protein
MRPWDIHNGWYRNFSWYSFLVGNNGTGLIHILMAWNLVCNLGVSFTNLDRRNTFVYIMGITPNSQMA